jgi:hypothetical protein
MNIFKLGDTFYLRRDINLDMRGTLVEWKKCRATITRDCSEEEIEIGRLHLVWMSRKVKHLQDELNILSSAFRSKGYIDHIAARRVHVYAER